MNLLRNVGSALFGGDAAGSPAGAPGAVPVVVTGALYDFPNRVKRCVFIWSEASIVPAAGRPFQYVLRVRRLVEEGETLDEGDMMDVSFELIHGHVAFERHNDVYNHVSVFSWSAQGQGWAFEVQQDSQDADRFHLALCRGLYENAFQRSSIGASEQDLVQFCGNAAPSSHLAQPPGQSAGTAAPLTGSGAVLPSSAAPVPSATVAAEQYLDMIATSALSPARAAWSTGSAVMTVKADLYTFDEATAQFVIKMPGVVASIVNTGNLAEGEFAHKLLLNTDPDQCVLAQVIDSDMQLHFNEANRSVVWVYVLGAGAMAQVVTLSLVLPDITVDRAFKETLAKCLYENNQQEAFGKKVKNDDDLAWIMGAYREDYVDVIDDDDDADRRAGDDDGDDYDNDEEMTLVAEEAGGHDASAEPAEEEKNKLLSVGYTHNRAFVVRGSKVGVFKQDDDRQLEYDSMINELRSPEDGKLFSPTKAMLHAGDSSLLLLHPSEDKSNRVMRLDLERGEVVEEWQTNDIVPVDTLAPTTKYAQATGEQTLLGLNKQGMFLLDPRLAGDKLVSEQSMTYQRSTNPQLSCIATTEGGQFVVGSAKGELRLFSNTGIGKRAKTLLPGCGDPILGVDVSKDGKWILATCAAYLLVVPAKLPGGRVGFDVPMGKQKPVPRRLRLTPQDMARVGGQTRFSVARFNVNPRGERVIVTSTGPWLVTWDFAAVKKNKLQQYQLKQFSEHIVADEMPYKQDQEIVVAMPDDVTVARRTTSKKR